MYFAYYFRALKVVIFQLKLRKCTSRNTVALLTPNLDAAEAKHGSSLGPLVSKRKRANHETNIQACVRLESVAFLLAFCAINHVNPCRLCANRKE